MQWRNDIPKQTNADGSSLCKTQRWPWLVVITALTLATLACGFFDITSRSDYGHILIRKTLPTLTPTTSLPAQFEPSSEHVAVVPPTPLPPATNTPMPMPTFTPANTTADQSIAAPSQLTPLVVLNVRTGPGVEFAVVGKLTQGQSTEVIGRNPDGTWWQIVYPPDSTNPAWVSADTQYSTISNGEVVQVAQVPATPTPTVTLTPTPSATNTPQVIATAVPAMPTATASTQQPGAPTPTNTPDMAVIKAVFQVPDYVRPSVD